MDGKITGEAAKEFANITKMTRVAIKGTLKKQGSPTSFEGEIERKELAASISGTIEGTIDGKIKGGVEESVKGPFEGTFQAHTDEWRIDGIYTPPPAECSGIGRRREELEVWRTRVGRHRTNAQGDARKARLDARAEREKDLKAWEEREKGKPDFEEKKRLRLEAEKRLRLEAVAQPIVSDPDPPIIPGKFSQVVTGTMNTEKNKITLKLPALAVLNEKCRVVATTDPGELILEKHESLGQK